MSSYFSEDARDFDAEFRQRIRRNVPASVEYQPRCRSNQRGPHRAPQVPAITSSSK